MASFLHVIPGLVSGPVFPDVSDTMETSVASGSWIEGIYFGSLQKILQNSLVLLGNTCFRSNTPFSDLGAP